MLGVSQVPLGAILEYKFKRARGPNVSCVGFTPRCRSSLLAKLLGVSLIFSPRDLSVWVPLGVLGLALGDMY